MDILASSFQIPSAKFIGSLEFKSLTEFVRRDPSNLAQSIISCIPGEKTKRPGRRNLLIIIESFFVEFPEFRLKFIEQRGIYHLLNNAGGDRQIIKEMVQKWFNGFGKEIIILRLALKFVNKWPIAESYDNIEQRSRITEKRKFNKMIDSLGNVIKERGSSGLNSILENLTSLESLLDILTSNSTNDSVYEISENTIIYQNIRQEGKLMLANLRKVERWISMLEPYMNISDSLLQCRKSELNLLQGIKFRMNVCRSNCEEFGVILVSRDEIDDSDQDIMIDVPVTNDSTFASVPVLQPVIIEDKKGKGKMTSTFVHTSGLKEAPIIRKDAKADPLSVLYQESVPTITLEEPERVPVETNHPLLNEAPYVEYNDDLYYWDKNNLQFNTSGLEFHHRFYGDGKGENILSSETMARLKQRTAHYQRIPEKTDLPLKKCRFPLGNGNLCPRMHLEECTFHGIIVERDNLGKELYPAPTNQPSMQPPVKISKKRKEVSSTSIQRLSKTLSKKSAIQSVNRANDTEASLKLRERKIHKW